MFGMKNLRWKEKTPEADKASKLIWRAISKLPPDDAVILLGTFLSGYNTILKQDNIQIVAPHDRKSGYLITSQKVSIDYNNVKIKENKEVKDVQLLEKSTSESSTAKTDESGKSESRNE